MNEPEQLDILANELGATPKPNTPDPVPAPNTETDPAGTPNPTPTPQPNAESSVIKDLRRAQAEASQEAKNARAILERAAKAMGLNSIDELTTKLETDELTQQAKTNAISPELQKQLNEQKAELETFKRRQEEAVFESRMNALTKTQNISESDAIEFAKAAYQSGFDVTNPNLDLNAVYFAMNKEKVIAAEVEKAKQEVLADIQKQQKGTPAPNNVPGSTSGGEKGTLSDLLNDLSTGKLK